MHNDELLEATKGRELFFLRTCLERLGVRTVTVDLATSGKPSPAMLSGIWRRNGIMAENLAMVGDRLYTDIALGQTSGITTCLDPALPASEPLRRAASAFAGWARYIGR